MIKYKSEEDKDLCMSHVLEYVLKNWQSINTNRDNSFTYNYAVELTKRGLSSAYKILPELKLMKRANERACKLDSLLS